MAEQKPRHPRSPFPTTQDAWQFAQDNDLMTFQEIADRWNAMSGESITRGRVYQILRDAESKIAEALGEFEELL